MSKVYISSSCRYLKCTCFNKIAAPLVELQVRVAPRPIVRHSREPVALEPNLVFVRRIAYSLPPLLPLRRLQSVSGIHSMPESRPEAIWPKYG